MVTVVFFGINCYVGDTFVQFNFANLGKRNVLVVDGGKDHDHIIYLVICLFNLICHLQIYLAFLLQFEKDFVFCTEWFNLLQVSID